MTVLIPAFFLPFLVFIHTAQNKWGSYAIAMPRTPQQILFHTQEGHKVSGYEQSIYLCLIALTQTIISTKCSQDYTKDQSSYNFDSHVPLMKETLDTAIFWKVLVC